MSSASPFFSAALLVTAPDGTYGGLRKRKRVSAFDDRIELDDVKVYYPHLTDLRVYGNVLHVGYTAADGKPFEQFFRYDTFLAKKGAKALAEMAARVAAARLPTRHPPPAARQAGGQVQQAVRAELLDPTPNGWQRVLVYSALVAFPAICPVCQRPAETIGSLQASAGLNEKGSWLIPICRAHEREFTSHMNLGNWRADRSRLEFMFWNKDYAQQFILVNRGEDAEQIRRQGESSPLLFEIKNGKRLIIYQYALSVLVLSMLRPSKVEILEPQQSAFTRGLKYSGISLVAGWWGIPAGPIFTIASIIRNCRGGIDITHTVAAVLSGSALSAGGYR